MPTESKSETPRTDAELRSYRSKNWKDKSSQEMLCIFARQLEKELNEANDKLAEAQQWLDSEPDWKDKFFANYYTLAKENKVMREALLEVINCGACDLHDEGCPEDDTCDCRLALQVNEACSSKPPTNLIVLTRNELIAEIEKMPCGCDNEHMVLRGKCQRCKRLEELKGSK